MKPVKKTFALLIAGALALSLPAALQARILFSFDFLGRQEIVNKASLASREGSLLGFSLATMTEGHTDFHVEPRLSYTIRKADQIGFGLNKISEFGVSLGLRYCGWDPTFSLGNIDVRLTFSAQAGFAWLWGGDYSTLPQFSPLLSGGLNFGTAGSDTQVMVECLYWPASMDMELKNAQDHLVGTVEIKPAWCLRVSVLFFWWK
jgi:hypothetical protein